MIRYFSIAVISCTLLLPISIMEIKGKVQYYSPLLGRQWKDAEEHKEISDISRIRTAPNASCLIKANNVVVKLYKKTIIVFASKQMLSCYAGTIKVNCKLDFFTVESPYYTVRMSKSVTALALAGGVAEIYNFLNLCEIDHIVRGKKMRSQLGPYQKLYLKQNIKPLNPYPVTKSDIKDWNITVTVNDSNANDYPVLEALAFYYLANTEFKYARKMIEIARDLYPVQWRVQYLFGLLYLKQDNYMLAYDHFNKAIDLSDNIRPKIDALILKSKMSK
ncbi:tetratricopeptide repeat protein [Spirochaetota bacterium]